MSALYSKNKSGKTLVWSAVSDYTLNAEGQTTIVVTFGQLDGKIQTKLRHVKSR